MPGGQEPAEHRRRDRLGLLAQPGQAAPPQHAQDVAVAPLGAVRLVRNSPSATRPSAASRRSVIATTATPSPYRDATSAAVNGPCVRAHRATRSPSGSGSGSVNASGMPTGSATPSASRSRPASSIAAHIGCPATRTSMMRRADGEPASQLAGRLRASAPRRHLLAVSGPDVRSRSATASASRQRRARRQVLQVGLGLRHDGRVEQLAQRLGAEQLRAAASGRARAPARAARPAARRPRT